MFHATLGALEILIDSFALETPFLTTFARYVITTTFLLAVTLAGWTPFQIVGFGVLSQGSRSIFNIIFRVFPFSTSHVFVEVISTLNTVVFLTDGAFKIILSDNNVKAVLINIFGGIVRCDLIAEGVIGAVEEIGVSVPVVVRLEGNNAELGRKVLADSGLNIIAASSLTDAAQQAVAAAGGAAQ